jgi:hypothetical protein
MARCVRCGEYAETGHKCKQTATVPDTVIAEKPVSCGVHMTREMIMTCLDAIRDKYGAGYAEGIVGQTQASLSAGLSLISAIENRRKESKGVWALMLGVFVTTLLVFADIKAQATYAAGLITALFI